MSVCACVLFCVFIRTRAKIVCVCVCVCACVCSTCVIVCSSVRPSVSLSPQILDGWMASEQTKWRLFCIFVIAKTHLSGTLQDVRGVIRQRLSVSDQNKIVIAAFVPYKAEFTQDASSVAQRNCMTTREASSVAIRSENAWSRWSVFHSGVRDFIVQERDA